MNISRKQFLKQFSSLGVLIGAGLVKPLKAQELIGLQDQVKFRFIVASDAHYGQPDTRFAEMAETFITKANTFHKQLNCDFCVLNGDIIHDEAKYMPFAKSRFDELEMPLHAVQGNHDHLTPEAWEKIWGQPVNYSFDMKGYKIVLVTTTDDKGTYLSPDLDWLGTELQKYKESNVLLFVHIPQTKWTKHAIETPEFFEVIKAANNVKAVFHGHEHDQDGIYRKDEVPYIFDSHIGGSWGTGYRGFRVVEVLDDGSIITYMMNPDVAMERIRL